MMGQPAVGGRPVGRPRFAQWLADLLMGARLAASGGRDGLTRTAMTTVGVGLGVAMLLLAVAVPGTWAHRAHRMDLREPGPSVAAPAANTLLIVSTPTVYRGRQIRGELLRPDGAGAPVPPGLTRLPASGEAYVSPALRKLLDSGDGALLRARLPYRIAGTVGHAGLSGPAEFSYYAGSDRLTRPDPGGRSVRVASFGSFSPSEGLDPVLILFVVVIFVVLLLPVGVFVASAVRFGGDQRDRRLAALRLVGADTAMARRIAAGEALAAALLGLLIGGALFLLGRRLAELVTLQDISVYAGDIRPATGAVVLVALVVPALAVAVTLLELRGVVIEPLGVVRRARPARVRLWWRLLLPAAGLAFLYPLLGRVTRNDPSPAGPYWLAAGVVLLLIGVVALLPWLVEATVARLGRGPVAWQLAVRRLQLHAGSPGRVVNGIAVAVAGAIALQMLFTGIEPAYTQATGADLSRANVLVQAPSAQADAVRRGLAATPGVTDLLAVRESQATAGDDEAGAPVLLADCAVLRRLATLPACANGDVFLAGAATTTGRSLNDVAVPGPGARLRFGESTQPWRVPANARRVPAARSGAGAPFAGLLLTPAAAPRDLATGTTVSVYLHADPADPDTIERVRNTVEAIDPTLSLSELSETVVVNRFANMRRGLFIGAVITLLLIGLSLLVGILEQLRDRRRLLAVLSAVGARRGTLGWSVLWQTALPVALGLLLAVPSGIGLGWVLLAMVREPLRVNAAAVAGMAGAAGAVVLLVTAASLPALWRIMRAEGLRTE